MDRKEPETRNNEPADADENVIGRFNKAIDHYSQVSSEELLSFLSTLDESENQE